MTDRSGVLLSQVLSIRYYQQATDRLGEGWRLSPSLIFAPPIVNAFGIVHAVHIGVIRKESITRALFYISSVH